MAIQERSGRSRDLQFVVVRRAVQNWQHFSPSDAFFLANGRTRFVFFMDRLERHADGWSRSKRKASDEVNRRRLLRIAKNPCVVALNKREPDFHGRGSCHGDLVRLGGLGGHDGLGVGHDGPPAIVASCILYITTTKGLSCYSARASSVR